MPAAMRPGDVLADRYRLVDLLSESRGGRFWRAWDGVLARHVALHLIPKDDERSTGLTEAARRSATLHDPRLLRVLDADTIDELCYVVNEWGEGDSLDQLLLEGPLAPRRAAWVVSEVGALVAHAHTNGIAHGRLVPENVLVDESGAVKVIGLAVDAALHGLPIDRTGTDVIDLAGLLYASLTGKWPGVSRSQVPAAPQEHGRPLRPRQVRAGVPRVLDTLCDEVLSPFPGHHDHGYDSARAITDALVEYVGDPAAVAAAEGAMHRGAAGPRMSPIGATMEGLPRTATDPEEPPTDPEPGGRTEETSAPPAASPAGSPPAAPAASPAASPTASPAGPVERTQAGVPLFYEEIEDVGWMSSAGEGAPPPPPPFEDPPERPLFAPDVPGGRTTRLPAAPLAPASPGDTGGTGHPEGTGSEYWPWDSSSTGTGGVPFVEDDEPTGVPGRNWLRTAAALALALVVLVAMVYAFDRGRGASGPLGEEPADDPSVERSDAQPVRVTVSDFDPFGDPPEENPDQAALAADGNASTAWGTMTYEQNLGPQGLKTGVGLLFDLGSTRDVQRVEITFASAPTAVQILTSEEDDAPTAVEGLEPVAEGRAGGNRITLTPEEVASARWVVVWLTSLPDTGDGFRGQVAEVRVFA